MTIILVKDLMCLKL